MLMKFDMRQSMGNKLLKFFSYCWGGDEICLLWSTVKLLTGFSTPRNYIGVARRVHWVNVHPLPRAEKKLGA